MISQCLQSARVATDLPFGQSGNLHLHRINLIFSRKISKNRRSAIFPFAMAKLEELDDSTAKTHKKKNHGSTRFFVFVDYLFLLIFVAFLSFIIFKMVGI